jgi:hypothetical protein
MGVVHIDYTLIDRLWLELARLDYARSREANDIRRGAL